MGENSTEQPGVVTVRAPGKVNLQLWVGEPDRSGYHELTTVYQAVGLYDDLRMRVADRLTLDITGPTAAGVDNDETNLVVRAVRLLAAATGRPDTVALELVKRIPVQGGMGGGSADAAAAMVAYNHLFGCGLSRDELAALGARLGADVPFCVTGGTAIGRRYGDVVTAVSTTASLTWVFAVARGGLSTADVFRQIDRRGEFPDVDDTFGKLVQSLEQGDTGALPALLSNMAQPAALDLYPGLADILAAGAGASRAIVSGTGATTAFLVEDEACGRRLARKLESVDECTAAHVVSGPVAGPEVIAVGPA